MSLATPAPAAGSIAQVQTHMQTHAQSAWAALLMQSFADAGVTDVIVSPGSRSTPFVFAAAREPRLRLRAIVDERAAAFFALGQARVSGRPSLLLCTSGTAGAHYLPALLEASAAYVPVIVLTADRPPELQHCGAPQTIDQTKLYGDAVRRFFELGLPDASAGALRALKRIAAQAVAESQWPLPGAVHVNARARKPLEPPAESENVAVIEAPRAADRAVNAAAPKVALPRMAPSPAAITELAARLASAERPVFVCGPAPAVQGHFASPGQAEAYGQAEARDRVLAPLVALAERLSAPVFADPASQLRFAPARAAVFIDAYDTILRARDFAATHRADLVVQLGAAPTSGRLDEYRAGCREKVVITPYGWPDPHSDAAQIIISEMSDALAALDDAVAKRLDAPERDAAAARRAWLEQWREADRVAWQVVAGAVEGHAGLSEAQVTRATVAAAPEGAWLMLGNSLPIRHVDTYVPGAGKALQVLSQRGVNGIDGLVSGAAGAAAAVEARASVDATDARPVTLLVGDVSFVHDLGGLAAARDLRAPLVIVVVQNYGGRIFEALPVASRAPAETMAYFTTPHAFDLSAAAKVFGHAYARAETRPALSQALAEAYARRGCTIIEAVVPPSAAEAQNRALSAALAAALA